MMDALCIITRYIFIFFKLILFKERMLIISTIRNKYLIKI
ncbi:hypothetical protein D0N43_05915 [Klebsiella aerogenes]|uniref:Uncharacterized protein n=1 Tax=Klebsiella aerogenes (strain ATCC 13048 / DSM 30053 / CCUG 1429 / JCM 1235 / KCTC 2190 / NBRC 13534 / NCIMB 10102 / NCTC 10006 / CDC 819-56) TaxID=1028307 RepID=A0A0H3FM44_KLEAK|nr:hypothetical protein EAE_02775 [Klebsiella aerogenes KCTC 2190]QEU21589.1 hypothetical protein FOB49_24450 [Klebsiella aerogenes]RFP75140.1 hypothetical protein D0N43_05915 [Klebsiella aerogenes]